MKSGWSAKYLSRGPLDKAIVSLQAQIERDSRSPYPAVVSRVPILQKNLARLQAQVESVQEAAAR